MILYPGTVDSYSHNVKLSSKVLVLSIVKYRPPLKKHHQFDPNEILALILSSNPNLASQLRLRQLDNDALFEGYINELKLRNLSPIYIKKVWELLSKFKET